MQGTSSSPASLAARSRRSPGYQLPAVCPTAHSQGLEQPQSLDGTSQLLQFLGAKDPAGLIGIG